MRKLNWRSAGREKLTRSFIVPSRLSHVALGSNKKSGAVSFRRKWPARQTKTGRQRELAAHTISPRREATRRDGRAFLIRSVGSQRSGFLCDSERSLARFMLYFARTGVLRCLLPPRREGSLCYAFQFTIAAGPRNPRSPRCRRCRSDTCEIPRCGNSR